MARAADAAAGGVAAPVPARVCVVEHEEPCPPALLGRWLVEEGAVLDLRRPWAGDALPPDLAEHDAVVVLGGSMGAGEEARHPWLGPVKALVRDAVARGVPLLGVCLGHQLAADALGGRVERNPRGQQVGLLDVGWLPAAAEDPLLGAVAAPGAAARRGVQWNNDLVTVLPPGAVALASTGHGELQAARMAPTVWGVQLHPEVDRAVVAAWAAGDRADHLERGLEQDAVLAAIEAARGELDAAWRPLATRLVGLALEHRSRRAALEQA